MSLPRHLQQLEARLASLAGDEPMLLSELDGFLTGILVCPELIMPSEWLPIVLGQDGPDEPVFENENAMQETVRLVFKHYNVLSRTLQHDSGRYQPVFDVDARHDECSGSSGWPASSVQCHCAPTAGSRSRKTLTMKRRLLP